MITGKKKIGGKKWCKKLEDSCERVRAKKRKRKKNPSARERERVRTTRKLDVRVQER